MSRIRVMSVLLVQQVQIQRFSRFFFNIAFKGLLYLSTKSTHTIFIYHQQVKKIYIQDFVQIKTPRRRVINPSLRELYIDRDFFCVSNRLPVGCYCHWSFYTVSPRFRILERYYVQKKECKYILAVDCLEYLLIALSIGR